MWLSGTLINSTLASLVFALNAIALVVWEIASNQGLNWMQGRTYPRIMAFGALSNLLVPTVIIIIGASFDARGNIGVISPVLYGIATVVALYYYQYRKPDLLILTMCVFGAIMVFTSFFIRYMLDDISGALMLAILLIAQVAGAAYWLRNVSRHWQATS